MPRPFTCDRRMRWLVVSLAFAAGLLSASGEAQPASISSPPVRVIATCDFEGPYSSGEHEIQAGCQNNWEWGRKDMALKADRDAGRPGMVQRVQVRGLASGGIQFFFTKLTLKRGLYYRISYWMKGDGLEGPVRCHVRNVPYPWTTYVSGHYAIPSGTWKQYSFWARCTDGDRPLMTQQAPTAGEASNDVGVYWEMSGLGTIWLDDLVVEESDQPFAVPAAASQALSEATGNLLPRSSCEGLRDNLWCTLEMGLWENGVWRGVETDWEDPQMVRAEGGKFGRYCMAVPAASRRAVTAAQSRMIEVLPGRPYTLSLWMKADQTNYPGGLGLLYWQSGRHHQGLKSMHPTLSTEWQHFSLTAVPELPPGSTDTNTPVTVAIQVWPDNERRPGGTVFVDGIQLEAGTNASPYTPRYPLELYADIGQPGGNLIEWGQKVSLTVVAAAADRAPGSKVKVEVAVVGCPDTFVWRKVLRLRVDEPRRLDLDLKRRGLMRVELRTLDPALAAPQEFLFAAVPKPRGTGAKGMFGTHIALRPFLVDYVRRLGFTWTRLHDCSLLTKWFATEPEPGKFSWHDDVAAAVRKGGLNILGLADDAPKWAETPGGTNVIDLAAWGRYCETIARRYRGTIDHWEIWNEPYMPRSFLDGTQQQFGEAMKVAYAAFKRGNPDCKVLGWCVDITYPKWGAQIPPDARACIDAFTFHNYMYYLCGGGTLPLMAELPEHRKQFGVNTNKECWNSEGTNGELPANSFYTFLPSPLFSADKNARAAAFASRVWLEHAKVGVDKFFLYTMHNIDSPMYMGGYMSLMISYDRSPTPAAVACATTAYAMDGLRSVPFVPVAGVVQALFSGAGRATWAVYDDAGVTGRVRLDLRRLPKDAEVFDVMGNDPRRDGRDAWEIGIQPLFVLSARLSADELAAAGQAAMRN